MIVGIEKYKEWNFWKLKNTKKPKTNKNKKNQLFRKKKDLDLVYWKPVWV
jgi:hypothetical protein